MLRHAPYSGAPLESHMETIRIAVDGMSCGHCISAVEQALRQVPGVEEVQVDLEGAEVRGNAAVPDLETAIVQAGYTPRPRDRG
jgi:copper chaperone